MKTIKIMIAASEEMHDEKVQFSELIGHLNEVLEPRGIELKRVKWNPETDRSVEDYQKKLTDCEMCLTLYWNELTRNSKEELNVAYQQLKDGGNPRKLYVFFKEPAENLSDALKEFKANFVTNYGHFFCKFENVDTMNLHFILQFEAYQNNIYDLYDKLVEVKDSKVIINEKPFVHLDQVPFAALNQDYCRLHSELAELDLRVTEARKKHQKDPNNEELEDVLFSLRSLRKEKSEEFKEFQNHLYDVALKFAKLSEGSYSERMRKARELFEKGDAVGADEILNMEEMKRDLELKSKQYEQDRFNLEQGIDEFRLKANTVMANTFKPVADRFAEACDAYESALGIAKIIHYEKEETANILHDYASLLENYHKIEDALSKLFLASDICVELAYSNNDDYSWHNVACLYNHIANLQITRGKEKEAIDYYNKAIVALEKTNGGNPIDYLSFLATIHHNHAILQTNLENYTEAEKEFMVVLGIYDILSVKNSGLYLEDKAETIGEIAVLHRRQGRYSDAEKEYFQRLDIYNSLAKNKPEKYLYQLGGTHNNLAVLYIAQENFQKAEKELNEALKIRKHLADDNPEVYNPDYAETLNNLGNVCLNTGRYTEAKEKFEAALNIWEIMAKDEPNVFCIRVARQKYNLGQFYRKMQLLPEAEKTLSEAIEIFRVTENGTSLYRSEMAFALFSLSNVKAVQKSFHEARNLTAEALYIFRGLERNNPGYYTDYISDAEKVLTYLNYKI